MEQAAAKGSAHCTTSSEEAHRSQWTLSVCTVCLCLCMCCCWRPVFSGHFLHFLTFAVDVVVGHSVRWREVTEGSKK